MEIKGIFFDGKTSKPYPVFLELDNENLHVLHADQKISVPLTIWSLSDCTIESLNASDNVLVKHPSHPGQMLEFRGDYGRQIITMVSHDDGILQRTYQNMMTEHPVRLIIGGLVVLLATGYLYLAYLSPFVANRVVDIIPQSAEIALGESTLNQISTVLTIDEQKSAIMQDFYDACGFESSYPIEIQVIDEDVVNAFAAPGGNILVFQGIIDKTESWESLAGLLAHEKAHVEERHSLRLIARSASSYLIISALTGDIAGISGAILDNAFKLRELSNSRDFERDADAKGLSNLKELRIRPEGMKELFEILMNETDIPEDLEFLSTHPLSTKRIDEINAILDSEAAYSYEAPQNDEAERLWMLLKNE